MKFKWLTWVIALSILFSSQTNVFASEPLGNENTDTELNDTTQSQDVLVADDEGNTGEDDELFSELKLNQVRWTDITSSKMLLLELESDDIYRYEVFYDAYASCPELLLISPTGFIHKPDSGSVFISKKEQPVPGHSGIMYKTFYIVPEDESGTWKFSITPSDGQKFLCVIKTEAPENWEIITQEDIITPKSILTWYMHEVVFKDKSIKEIVSPQKEKPQNGMQSVQIPSQEPQEQEPSATGDMTLVYVAVIAGCCVWILISQFSKKRKKAVAEKKRQQRIEAANNALAEERKKENERLEEMMLQYEAEYIDYPDPVMYYEKSIQDGLQIHPIKQEEPKAPVEFQQSTISTTSPSGEEKQEDSIINYF